MTQPTIGGILRKARQERGLSLRDLERRSGVLLGAIGAIERDEVKAPSLITVARICLALGLSVDQLLEEAGIVPPSSERRRTAPATQADIDELRAEIRRMGEGTTRQDERGDG